MDTTTAMFAEKSAIYSERLLAMADGLDAHDITALAHAMVTIGLEAFGLLIHGADFPAVARLADEGEVAVADVLERHRRESL